MMHPLENSPLNFNSPSANSKIEQNPFAFTGYTWDELLLLPNETDVIPSSVSTKSRFTKNITLHNPLLSAAMDTVTESHMAIAMARQGGMGILHRNLSIEEQAEQVDYVKRSQAGMINNPVTISPQATIAELDYICGQYRVSGLPVVDENGFLVGIITNRDLRLLNSSEFENTYVKDIMTKDNLLTAPPNTTKKQATEIFKTKRVEKLPLVDKQGKLTGLITVRDIVRSGKYLNATLDDKNRLRVGAAVGFFGDALQRAKTLVDAGVDVLVVDTAHGHAKAMLEMIATMKKDKAFSKTDIVGGNVATYNGAKALIEAGVDAIKVGIGPGSICTTRIIAGIGVPQATAVYETARAAQDEAKKTKTQSVPIIADGGMKYSGDIAKAIVAGADTTMFGRLLAGCDESPGDLIWQNNKQYKQYRGMGSLGAMSKRGKKSYSRDRYFQADVENDNELIPEGIEGQVPYRGTVAHVTKQLIGGLHQSMFYVGASNIKELKEKGRFVKITDSGRKESHPHFVEGIKDAPNYY